MDGVLRFKNKWGMRILNPTPKGLLLKPLRNSEGAMSFLENNPFIDCEGEEFVGMVFSDDSTSTVSYRDLCAPYLTSSLRKLKIYSNKDHESNSTMSDKIDNNIAIASTNTLF